MSTVKPSSERLLRDAETLLALPQRLLRAPLVVDVGADAGPFDDPTRCVAHRRRAAAKPAVGPIIPAQTRLEIVRMLALRAHALLPRGHHPLAIVRVIKREPVLAEGAARRRSGVLVPHPVQVVIHPARVRFPDDVRHALGEAAKARLALAQRVFRALALADVEPDADVHVLREAQVRPSALDDRARLRRHPEIPPTRLRRRHERAHLRAVIGIGIAAREQVGLGRFFAGPTGQALELPVNPQDPSARLPDGDHHRNAVEDLLQQGHPVRRESICLRSVTSVEMPQTAQTSPVASVSGNFTAR